jgi:hypothetical protein
VPPAISNATTTRERYKEHSTNPVCASCHSQLDPVGLAFEHFDAIGHWLADQGGLPIDATGTLTNAKDAEGPFNGASELSRKLALSSEAQRCFATQVFRFALGRQEVAEDAATLETIYQAFAKTNFNVRDLMVAVAASYAFLHGQKVSP